MWIARLWLVLRRRRRQTGISRRPRLDVSRLLVAESGGSGAQWTYFSHADPALCNVDQKAVLCPFPCALCFLGGEICAVLLEVDLHDDRYPT
jgi:hypothetical protein